MLPFPYDPKLFNIKDFVFHFCLEARYLKCILLKLVSLEGVICNLQLATRNLQLATRNSQLATRNLQLATRRLLRLLSLFNEAMTVDYVAYCTSISYRLILLAFQFSPFACSLYSSIICLSCICFVFVPYALTLPVSGLSFMSIKICSVLSAVT